MQTNVQPSLYEKLGGEAAISAVVDYFYARIMEDESLEGFFWDTDMERQRRHQTAFVTMATGGPNRYTGRSMEKAHEGLQITMQHFESVVGHLAAALKHFNVGDEEIAELAEKLAPLRDVVVTA